MRYAVGADVRVGALALESHNHFEKLRERAWRVTMAPRQLRLEPIEVDMGVDKGLKRVRVESTEES
eukprot:scaffold13372_cov112-Isochrysis_galbana.AAC.1